jgi:hypothetical protein
MRGVKLLWALHPNHIHSHFEQPDLNQQLVSSNFSFFFIFTLIDVYLCGSEIVLS